jgi:cytochrome c oxidase subunit 3
VAELLPEQKKKVQKPLLWVGLASIAMTFAGLTSGYVVSRSSLLADNEWLQFALPTEFTWATVVIVLSSATMIWAINRFKHSYARTGLLALVITLLLGFSFTFLQYYGWQDLLDRGLFFTGPKSNTAISWVYVITFLHWLHLISGLLVLLFTLHKARLGKYTAEDYQGVSVSGIYWHFLDGLWIYLFLFLSFIR